MFLDEQCLGNVGTCMTDVGWHIFFVFVTVLDGCIWNV
jgi:hypothetical protein